MLSALVDSIKPGILTPTDLSGLSGDPITDVERAAQTALAEYGIHQLMDTNDIVSYHLMSMGFFATHDEAMIKVRRRRSGEQSFLPCR